jgi:hypothetical protein
VDKTLEVHEHLICGGPFAHGGLYDRTGKWDNGRIVHSHSGGEIPHTHPGTGPASYTIDKNEWQKATGLRGGGRKKFTAKPSGQQMPLVARTEEENTFELILCKPTPPEWGLGPGIALPARMIFGSRLKWIVRDESEVSRG